MNVFSKDGAVVVHDLSSPLVVSTEDLSTSLKITRKDENTLIVETYKGATYELGEDGLLHEVQL